MLYVTKTLLLALALATASGVSAAPKKADPQAQSKICLKLEASTGSRMSKTECRTRAEWAELGVELDEAAQK